MTHIRQLIFEQLNALERHGSESGPTPLNEELYRAQVPGGWLILSKRVQPNLLFYPDPQHRWDGGSIEA